MCEALWEKMADIKHGATALLGSENFHLFDTI